MSKYVYTSSNEHYGLMYKAEHHQLNQDAGMVRYWLSDIHHIKQCYHRHVSDKSIKLPPDIILRSLGNSSRCCTDPVDYFYGVLGIFRFNIPRMKDPNAVWQSFLCKIQDYLHPGRKRDTPTYKTTEISYRAHQVDLLKVRNMADVYRDFLLTESTYLKMYLAHGK